MLSSYRFLNWTGLSHRLRPTVQRVIVAEKSTANEKSTILANRLFIDKTIFCRKLPFSFLYLCIQVWHYLTILSHRYKYFQRTLCIQEKYLALYNAQAPGFLHRSAWR